jgi:hypothetical protein
MLEGLAAALARTPIAPLVHALLDVAAALHGLRWRLADGLVAIAGR